MTISVQQAQSDLPMLIDQLSQDEAIVITRNGQPVAKLIGPGAQPLPPRQPGWGKAMIEHISEDFDAPLDDFREYTA